MLRYKILNESGNVVGRSAFHKRIIKIAQWMANKRNKTYIVVDKYESQIDTFKPDNLPWE